MKNGMPEQTKSVPTQKQSLLKAFWSGVLRAPLAPMERGWRESGDLYHFYVGREPFPIISHPDYAQEVLVTQRDVFQKLGKAPRGDVLALVLGNGLITNADTNSWLAQRRMMQHMFHKRRLAAMAHEMTAAGERMLLRWAALPDGAEVDINNEMMHVTMEIVTRTMFSSGMTQDENRVGDSINEALHFAFHRRGPVQLPLDWPLPQHRRFRRAVRVLDETVYGFIDQRRGHEAAYDDLLSMLMAARDAETGEGMSRQQLRDEVATIFGAGHETTSHGLTWTLYLLAQHPDVMARLQAEVDGVLHGRFPTFADLPTLPYTRMVFEEALRLYPPAPIVPRYAAVETAVDGYRIPAGSINLILIWNIHRHPDVWERPQTFWPARFAPERSEARHRMAFMPFGGGQRMCIGNNFAMIEGQLLLAMMAQAYSFSAPADYTPQLDLAITLRPKHGLPLRLHRR